MITSLAVGLDLQTRTLLSEGPTGHSGTKFNLEYPKSVILYTYLATQAGRPVLFSADKELIL